MKEKHTVQQTDLKEVDHLQLEELFASAYGNRFRDAKQLKHIGNENPHFVFSVVCDEKMLAASIVRADGKRRGIAVRPQCQGKGHSASLLRRSLEFLPNQFVEISVDNSTYQKQLVRFGFRPVAHEDEVKDGIRDTRYEPVKIEKFLYLDGRLAYERSFIFSGRTITKRLFMLRTEGMNISERLKQST